MAATAEGTRLTQLHRQRQLALRAVTLRQSLFIWPAFDLTNIDATWPRVEAGLMALIGQHRAVSSGLSTAYYRAFRAAEGVAGAAPPLLTLPSSWQEAAQVSLRVTGPVAAKQLLAAGMPNVADQVLVRLSGSVGRHVLNAGRESLPWYVQRDRVALGWARVTAFNPCAFCAMLASRGPVYSKRGGGFQAHDHCSCTLEPVFRRDQPWPGRSREFRDMWGEATKDTKGAESARAFRRAFEGRT